MPIRIKCPKCQTGLAVKEALAGKRVNCPKCRCVLRIPAPKVPPVEPPSTQIQARPAEDVDAEAHKMFAEEAPKPQAAPVKIMEFDCPFCMEKVAVSVELAGKQTPCPNSECKRIVKVPLLKEDKPKDWRDVNPRGPDGLLKKNSDEPEGAWSSAQKTRVSTEALVEADAIPVQREKVTVGTWIIRGVLATVALVAVVGGAMAILSWRSRSGMEYELNAALELAEPKETDEKKTPLKPAAAASILRGVGEFYVLRQKPLDAQKYFNKALDKLGAIDSKKKPDLERDTVLIDMALAMIDLAGSPTEVDMGTHIDWSDMELQQRLVVIGTDDARQSAVRSVGTRLIGKKQGDMAVWLASQVLPPDPAPPPPPQDGSEPKKPPPPPPRSPLHAQLVALQCATGQTAEAEKIFPAPGEKTNVATLNPVARHAYAEARARQGNFEGARQLANPKDGDPLNKLEASLGVALIALEDKKMDEAKASAQDALAAQKALGKRTMPPWVAIQLTRVFARTDLAEEARKIADGLTAPADKEARALAQLELLLAKLDGNEPATATMATEYVTAKDTLGYGLAMEKVARQLTRQGRSSEALTMLENLDDSQKAFVHIGVALGQADTQR